MKRLINFLLLMLLSSAGAIAQSTLLQDKSGAGSLVAWGNNLSLNISDASLTASIDTGHSNGKGLLLLHGFNIKFKATEGSAALTDGTKLKLTVDFGGYYGWGLGANRMYLAGKLSRANFNLLKTDNTNTFENKNFYGGTLLFTDNWLTSLPLLQKGGHASTVILGGSIGIGRINNLSDLTATDTYMSVSTTKNDTVTTALSGKKSGYGGIYKESYSALLNIDAYIFPRNLGGFIGIGAYSRSQLGGYQPRTSAGLGGVLGHQGAPTNINFGVFYQFNDLFNQLDKENDFLKRGGLNIVAGYKF